MDVRFMRGKPVFAVLVLFIVLIAGFLSLPFLSEEQVSDVRSKISSDLLETDSARVIIQYGNGSFSSANLTKSELLDAAKKPEVQKIYSDEKVTIQLSESGPLIKEGWTAIEQQFGYQINGTGEKIAILDTGIDKTHPDLNDLDDNASTNDPKVILEQDFTGCGHVYDDHGHGTHCASIAAGTGEAGNYTYVGVAPGAWLLNGKVLDKYGNGWKSDVIAGIQWAVENGANVISLSLGDPSNNDGSDPLSQAVDWAVGQGVVCVVAAGNNGNTYYSVGCPACAKEAITVGATDKTDKIAWFSSFGPTSDFRVKPEILAPGVNIVAARANGTSMGTVINQYYTMSSGTSMATPHVAGAVALLLQAHPDWNAETVKTSLVETAKHIRSDVLAEGGGRIQIAKAINLTSFAYPSTLSFGKIKESTSLNLTVSTAAFSTSVIPYFTTGITVSAVKTENIVSVSVGGDLTEGYYSGVIVVSGENSLQVPFFVAVYKVYPSGNWYVVNEETVPSNVPHRFVIDGNFIYVGCFDMPGAVYKYSLPDLALLASITLSQDKVNSMALLGDYLYVGTATIPAHLFKLNVTDLSIVADVAMPDTNALALATMGGYLFVSYSVSPGVVAKVDPASLQTVKTLYLSSNADTIKKLVSVGNHLYAGVYDYAGSTGHYSQICKIDPVSLTVLKTVNFAVGTTNLVDMVEAEGFLYACTWGNAVPAEIIKVDLATFQIVGTLSLGLYDNYVYRMNYANGHLYLASAKGHGIRVSLSTFEKDLELPLSDQAVEVACWQDYVFFGGYQHKKIVTTRDAEVGFYLTILSAVGGDTSPAPGTYEHPAGVVVQVTPLPDVSHVFSCWIMDGSQVGDNPLLVTMNANHTVQPIFAEVQTYFLEMESTVGGSVDPSVGIHEYKAGTVVTIKATADLNYKFKWWIVDGVCYTTNPNWVTMAYNRTVTAVFEAKQYSVTLVVKCGSSLLSGAEVYLDEVLVGTTNSKGKLVFSACTGTHNLKVLKAGYYDYSASLTITESMSVTVYMSKRFFTLSLTVKCGSTKISGATVYLDDVLVGETVRGKLVFTVEKGTHKLKIVKDGYYDNEATVTITQDTTLTVYLSQRFFQLTIKVKCGSKYLSGASVFIDGAHVGDTVSGVLTTTVENGTHTLLVTKTGYFDALQEITITKKTTITVYLVQKKVTVKIIVVDANTRLPILSARVYVDGVSKGYTNSNGELMVTVAEGEHAFKIVKKKYLTSESKVAFVYDSNIPVYTVTFYLYLS
jgi:subtilisin family serine protease